MARPSSPWTWHTRYNNLLRTAKYGRLDALTPPCGTPLIITRIIRQITRLGRDLGLGAGRYQSQWGVLGALIGLVRSLRGCSPGLSPKPCWWRCPYCSPWDRPASALVPSRSLWLQRMLGVPCRWFRFPLGGPTSSARGLSTQYRGKRA